MENLEVIKQKLSEIKDSKPEVIEKSKSEKLALYITNKVGTMGFFYIIFIWTVSWLGWNSLAPSTLRFDPYPAFVLWLFLSNMIQIFLMPLLLIGQNIQSKENDKKTEEAYRLEVKSELEIELLVNYLETVIKKIDELETKI